MVNFLIRRIHLTPASHCLGWIETVGKLDKNISNFVLWQKFPVMQSNFLSSRVEQVLSYDKVSCSMAQCHVTLGFYIGCSRTHAKSRQVTSFLCPKLCHLVSLHFSKFRNFWELILKLKCGNERLARKNCMWGGTENLSQGSPFGIMVRLG